MEGHLHFSNRQHFCGVLQTQVLAANLKPRSTCNQGGVHKQEIYDGHPGNITMSKGEEELGGGGGGVGERGGGGGGGGGGGEGGGGGTGAEQQVSHSSAAFDLGQLN